MTLPTIPSLSLPSAEPTADNPQMILLSHSNDSLLDYCPRKFEFIQLYKRFPPPESRKPDSNALSVGTAMHEAAQALIRGMHRPDGNPLDEACYALALHWDYSKEDPKRPMGAAVALLESMLADPFWNDWELCSIPDFGPAIEVPFLIVHESVQTPPGYIIGTQGKADLIMIHRRTKEIRVIDFKTSTQPEESWPALFQWSDQGVTYSFPIQALTGRPVGSPISVTYYLLSFGATVDDSPKTKPVTFHYTSEQIQQFIEDKYERVARVARYLHRRFPRRAGNCVVYNTPCAWFGVCGIESREFLHRWFAFERWELAERVYDPVWTFKD